MEFFFKIINCDILKTGVEFVVSKTKIMGSIHISMLTFAKVS